jgi:NAD-dependent DNA ligase
MSKEMMHLSRELYTQLNQEIDREHEMKWAKAEEYGREMWGFLRQLDTAVKHQRPMHRFRVTWSVADALASSNVTLAPVFSSHMFECMRA